MTSAGTKQWKGLRWLWSLAAVGAAVVLGVLTVRGEPLLVVALVAVVVSLPLAFASHLLGFKAPSLPVRRALLESFVELPLVLAFLALLHASVTGHFGWIQTAVEVAAGVWLLIDIVTWRRRRLRAGSLVLTVPEPGWLLLGFANVALLGILLYFELDYPGSEDLELLSGVAGVVILVGALESFLEVLVGTQLRDHGILFFGGLIRWSDIRRWEFDRMRLHLHLTRFPPLSRLMFGASIPQKSVVVFLSRDADLGHLEAVLRQRVYRESVEEASNAVIMVCDKGHEHTRESGSRFCPEDGTRLNPKK